MKRYSKDMAVRMTGCFLFLVSGCSPGSDADSGKTIQYVLEMNVEALNAYEEDPLSPDIRQRAVEQTIRILNKRIRDFGIRNAEIRAEGDRLKIEISEIVDDRRKAFEKLLLLPGFLEFRLVHEQNYQLTSKLFSENISPPGYRIVIVEGQRYFERDPDFKGDRESDDYKNRVANTGRISPLYELMLDPEVLADGRDVFYPYYVDVRTLLDGTAIKSARPEYDEYGGVQIALKLTAGGGRKFTQITGDYSPGGPQNRLNMSRKLAMVMDDHLLVAPSLNERISSPHAVISGNFAMEEAQLISDALNSGALPIPLSILSRETLDTQP